MTPRYEKFAPPDAIASHVHRLWLFEGTEDGAEQAVPPDGRCELIAHVGVPYEERGDDGLWREQPRLLFAGQLTRPLVLRAHGAVTVVAVRFTPAGAWAFAGRPLSSCTDLSDDLAELDDATAVAALSAALRDVFPARVVYWRDGADLMARIEGTVKGQPASVEWRFSPGTAADCPRSP